jgi:peptidoglycan/xylan/chitin deacetylase (PgdA/CDA1 family)
MVAGDTLFSLARRYGTTVEILKELNNIEDETTIPAGRVIFIPLSEHTATPTAPAASPTPTPTPSAGASTLVRNGPRTSNRVALTFDMGGRLEPAVEIMNFLVANRVRATIFPTGAALETPNSDLGRQAIAIAAANPDLFDIGNHSYSHPDFTTITSARIAEELSSTAAVIQRLTGMDPRPWFRPPFGAYNAEVLRAVGANGYAYTVMWDVDTIDWRPEAEGGPTADEIVAKVLANARGGSIVLMHLGGYNTLAALPRMVEGLRAAGFELATVAEVLAE